MKKEKICPLCKQILPQDISPAILEMESLTENFFLETLGFIRWFLIKPKLKEIFKEFLEDEEFFLF